MKHKILLLLLTFCFLWLIGLKTQAQITANPAIFTASQSVTLTYDATLSQGQQLANLPASVTSITAHVGAITDSPTSTSWTNVPGTWGDPSAQPKFTRVGTSNIYTLTLANGLRSIFLSLPAATPLFRVGMVLRENGPCGNFGGNSTSCKEGKSTTGQDIFLNINQGGFALVITSPTTSEILVNPSQNINITASTSQNASYQLFVDNVLVPAASASNTSLFSYTLAAATSGRKEVKITANNGSETLEEKFHYIVKQTPNVANLPAGLKDGVNYISTTSVTLSLLAPQKSFIYIVGDFNNWEIRPEYLANKSTNGERYWLNIIGLTAGQEYGFQYVVYDANNVAVRVADPFSELILDEFNDGFITAGTYPNLKPYPAGKTNGAVSVLQTNQTPYNWQVTNFQKPKKEDLVIYELLVRDFDTNGDYQDVLDRLDYLEDMGINAIELMPIMEFSGNDSWGYNPTFFTAVDKAYGTRNKLKELIDKCHQRGIAVILDMVLNHADREFPYVKLYFDGNNPTPTNPWFNIQATHPFSVFYDFNHESQYTKNYMDQVNKYWLEEYKFDGYRFDLSKGFTQNNTGDNVGAWSARDNSRIALLKRMADVIWATDPTAYIILEHFADNGEEKELAEYRAGETGKGMMLWGNMHGSFKENVLGFSNNSNITGTYAGNLTNGGGRGWTTQGLIGYMESHDEERQMVDALASGNNGSGYNIRNLATALDRIKTAGAFLFAIPGPKMYWQFGEVGYDVSINENGRTGRKPIRWEYFDEPNRNRLYRTFGELIKLKTTYPIFETSDVSIIGGNNTLKKITLTAQPFTNTPANFNQMSVHLLGNFGVTTQTIAANFQHTGTWYEYFSGSQNAPMVVTNASMEITLRAGEFRLYTNYPLPSPELELHNYTRPKAATAATATPVSDTEIRLNWTDNSATETSYKILRSLTSNGSFAEIAILAANITTYTDGIGLLAQTPYFYKIVAANASGDNPSAEVNATTLAPTNTPPAAPTSLVATPVGNSVNLTWTDNANNETSYVVERKAGTGAYTQIALLSANTSTYQDPIISLDLAYTYRVGAAIGSTKAYSNEANITVLANENNALANAIQVFPNPTSERVQIRLLSNAYRNVSFEINDGAGQKVRETPLMTNPQAGLYEWNLSKLSPGVYLLKVITSQGYAVKRIVKE